MADNEVSVKITADASGVTQAANSASDAISNFEKNLMAAASSFQDNKIASGLNNVSAAADAGKKSVDGLGFATAGATREFLVLGHEALTGNFSRIPGSLLVLGERMGGLHNIISAIGGVTLGWAAAIGVALFATYEWVAANEKLAESEMAIKGALELNNQGAGFNKAIIEDEIASLSKLSGVSKVTAEEIITAFSRAGNISVELKQKLISMVGDYAAATGLEAPKAAESLIKMFEDPEKGAKKLAETLTGVLTPAQLETIETMAKSGDTVKAQGALYDDLAAKIDGFRKDHLTPLQQTLQQVEDGFKAFGEAVQAGASAFGTPQPVKGENADAAVQTQLKYKEQIEQKQNDLNASVTKGLETEKQAGLLIARKTEMLEKQAALIKAANAAEEQGNLILAARFRNDAKVVGNDANNLKEKGDKSSSIATPDDSAQKQVEADIKEEGDMQAALAARVKLLSDAEVKSEEIKNQEMLDNGEITNAQFLQQKLALQQKIDAVDMKAMIAKRDILTQGTADYEKASNAILALAIKQGQEEEKINHEVMLDQEKNLKQLDQQMQNSFATQLANVISGTTTMTAAWHKFTTSVLNDIIQMASKQATSGLFNSITGAAASAGGSGGSLSGIGSAIGSIGSSIAGAFAGGGQTAVGDGYVVGENGPEFFKPNTSGNVYNQNQMQQMGGQNVTMNINTPNAQSFRQNMGQMMADMNANLARGARNA